MIGGFPDMWENIHQSFSPANGARGMGMESEFGQVSLEVSTYFWMIYAHCSFLFHTLSCLFLILSFSLFFLACLFYSQSLALMLIQSFTSWSHSSLLLVRLLLICLAHSCVSCILFLLPHLCSFTFSQLFTLLLRLTTTDRGLLTNTGRWTSTTSVTCYLSEHLFLHLSSGLIWDW